MKILCWSVAIWCIVWTPLRADEGVRRQIYKRVGDIELGLQTVQPEGHLDSNGRPAAIFFFGGGWSGGSPDQFARHARYLASRGMVVFLADYRTARADGTTPFECVKDAKSAVRWVRSHARQLGIDGQRLAAGGGSAGGHLAAATATLTGFDDPGDDVTVSAVPNALLLFNPVYDNGPDGYGYERVSDHYAAFSPIHNIRPGMPPTIVFLGTKDALIPVSTAQAFQTIMQVVGSRSELHLYEGQGHGFFNENKSRKYFYETVVEMDRFLESLGYVQGPPTLQQLTPIE